MRNVDSTGVDRSIGLIIYEYAVLGVVEDMIKKAREYIMSAPDNEVEERYRKLRGAIEDAYNEYVKMLENSNTAFEEDHKKAAEKLKKMLLNAIEEARKKRVGDT